MKPCPRIGFATAFAAVVFSSSANAFTHVELNIITPLIRFPRRPTQPIILPTAKFGYSKSQGDANDGGELKEDWKTLTKATGDFARHLGDKIKLSIQAGSARLLKVFNLGVSKVTSALLPSNTEDMAKSEQALVDKHDDALFRSLLGDGGLLLKQHPIDESSADAVMDLAASLLARDDHALFLLGSSGSLRYGRPFSQSSWTTTTNGESASTHRASFEVWGSKGRGLASVALTNGTLTSLNLNVNGRRYVLNTDAREVTVLHAEAYKSNHDSIEVEVLDRFPHPSTLRPSTVLDAEILDVNAC